MYRGNENVGRGLGWVFKMYIHRVAPTIERRVSSDGRQMFIPYSTHVYTYYILSSS